MKTIVNVLFVLMILIASTTACKKDTNDNNNNSTTVVESNLGTFQGSIQVVDDPQTQLGNIHNAEVTVIKKGTNVTVKVIGDLGFDREYIGTVSAATSDVYSITLKKQIKPTEKNAGDMLGIQGNKLTISIIVADDNVIVRETNSLDTIQISGKIGMIGTEMLKK